MHTHVGLIPDSNLKTPIMTKRPLLQPGKQWRLPTGQLPTILTGKAIAPAIITITSVMIAAGITVTYFGLKPSSLGSFIAYAMNDPQPGFDHHQFGRLLNEHVDEDGYVNYAKLQKHPDLLNTYIESLAIASWKNFGRDEKLAFLINAYNACTLRLILDFWDTGKLTSIRGIPATSRWDHVRWQLGPEILSLNQIEHKLIRPDFNEPRIHFALVCGAIGCPRLRNEAYDPAKLEMQLEDQMLYSHQRPRWLKYDVQNQLVYLTPLYKWYKNDFKQEGASLLAYAARYAPKLKKDLNHGSNPEIKWLDYDWTLNNLTNRPPKPHGK